MAVPRHTIVTRIKPWALSACEQAGVELWDIEYLREGGENYLRLYIDKADGISIEDCENVSHIMNDILDTEDPIDESYSFQVSSPGIERELKTSAHFDAFIGEAVRIKLYKAIDGSKEYIGNLISYDDTNITVTADDREMVFPREKISKVKIYFEF